MRNSRFEQFTLREFLHELAHMIQDVKRLRHSARGKQDGMHRHRECIYRAELDMETLVWTRGRDFPLSRLESRLKCPRCGSRQVALLFTVPSVPSAATGTQ